MFYRFERQKLKFDGHLYIGLLSYWQKPLGNESNPKLMRGTTNLNHYTLYNHSFFKGEFGEFTIP